MDHVNIATPGDVPIISSEDEEESLFEEYVRRGEPLIYIMERAGQYDVVYWMELSGGFLVDDAVNEIHRIMAEYADKLDEIEVENFTAGENRGSIQGLDFDHATVVAEEIQDILRNRKNSFSPLYK